MGARNSLREVALVTSTVKVTDLLANAGIADVTGLWPVEMVEDWNRRLDPIFAGTDGERRSYASADALAETGSFAELFGEPVRTAGNFRGI